MLLVYLYVGLFSLVIIWRVIRRLTDEEIPKDITDAQIADLARAGKRIQAMRWYRHLHGASLREAKEAVEAMMR